MVAFQHMHQEPLYFLISIPSYTKISEHAQLPRARRLCAHNIALHQGRSCQPISFHAATNHRLLKPS